MELIMNERIREQRVFVIGNDGAKIGEMDTRKAVRMAESQDMDLVIVSQGKGCPTAKIVDGSKYAYEQKQRQKQQKKNSKSLEVKEIRMSPNIAENDLNTKRNAARKFLEKGHEVKVTLMCRGREISRIDKLAPPILNGIAEDLGDCSAVKASIKVNGKMASMLLAPKKQ